MITSRQDANQFVMDFLSVIQIPRQSTVFTTHPRFRDFNGLFSFDGASLRETKCV